MRVCIRRRGKEKQREKGRVWEKECVIVVTSQVITATLWHPSSFDHYVKLLSSVPPRIHHSLPTSLPLKQRAFNLLKRTNRQNVWSNPTFTCRSGKLGTCEVSAAHPDETGAYSLPQRARIVLIVLRSIFTLWLRPPEKKIMLKLKSAKKCYFLEYIFLNWWEINERCWPPPLPAQGHDLIHLLMYNKIAWKKVTSNDLLSTLWDLKTAAAFVGLINTGIFGLKYKPLLGLCATP